MVKGGATLDLPQTTTDLPNENGSGCGGDPITLPRPWRCPATSPSATSACELGADALREQAEKFGFDQTLPRRPRRPGRSAGSPRTPTSRRPRCPAIGQFDVAATPLQMAMVAAGIANGGTVMRPYLVDEVRAPDLCVLDKTSPEDLPQQRGRRPRWPATSPR